MAKKSRGKSKKCLICGFDRITDRCHLIPKRILLGVCGVGKYGRMSDTGKNIIYLCRNHHFLFDSFKLNSDEWKIIVGAFKTRIMDLLLDVLNSNLKTKGKTTKEFIRKKRAYERWCEKVAKIMVEYKLLNYYGENEELRSMQ